MAAQAHLKLGEVSAESGMNKQNLGSFRWIHSCRAENGTNNYVSALKLFRQYGNLITKQICIKNPTYFTAKIVQIIIFEKCGL